MNDTTDPEEPDSPDFRWEGGKWVNGDTVYQIPIRTFWLIADDLSIKAGAREGYGDARERLESFRLISGTCQIDQRHPFSQVSMMGEPERRTRSFTLSIRPNPKDSETRIPPEEGISWKPAESYEKHMVQALSYRVPTAHLGFIAADWEIGNIDDWFVETYLRTDLFNDLVSLVRERVVCNLSIGIKWVNLYVTDYHAPPSVDVSWYLPPPRPEGSSGETAIGFVTQITWEERAGDPEQADDDHSEDVSKDAKLDGGIAPPHAQPIGDMGKDLRAIARSITSLTVVIGILVAVGLFLRR